MRLVTPYLENSYHLYADRFYTSTLLANELERRKTRYTGTLNSNRKDLPLVLKNTKNNKFRLPSGGYRAFCRGRSLVTAWKPEKKNNVLMLTTGYTSKLTTITRRSGETMSKPEVVHAYNQSMNGVDISDQFSVYYCFNRKSIKWWKKVFFWCVEVAIVNSHILYKSTSPHTSHLQYRRLLLNSFASAFLQSTPTISRGKPHLIPAETPERLDHRKHFLGKRATSDQHECKICVEEQFIFVRLVKHTHPSVLLIALNNTTLILISKTIVLL